MSVYLGVDFHARTQTVCWCDTTDGLIRQRTINHEHDDVRGFYTQLAVPATVGTGSHWLCAVVPSLAGIPRASLAGW
jgi:hypothetical protein